MITYTSMAKSQDTEVYEVKSRQISHFIQLCLLKNKWCCGANTFFKNMRKVNLNMIWVLNVKITVV